MERRRFSGINKTVIIASGLTAIAPTISAISTLMVVRRVETKVETVQEKVHETAAVVNKVEKQTNSMKDALVAAALKEGKVEGEKKGVTRGAMNEKARAATAKAEQAKGAATEKAKPFWQK